MAFNEDSGGREDHLKGVAEKMGVPAHRPNGLGEHSSEKWSVCWSVSIEDVPRFNLL